MSDAYKQAGVDIAAGNVAVERMKKHVKKTLRSEVLTDIGGFGGLFALSPGKYREPVLVSGTDGVGTKLMLAFESGRHDTIGIDAVAMCVNDIVVQGAEPLFFLDYLACGKVVPEKMEAIVKGISDGCLQAGCALIGGETAEMPGMYSEEEYDIGGFAVGVAERSELIDGSNIKPGDAILGMPSSGVHSNGFSLVRNIFQKQLGWKLTDHVEELNGKLGDVLLEPTKIYVKPILHMMKKIKVKGLSHITGGGFLENIPRILPENVGVEILRGSWPVQPIFTCLARMGKLSEDDLFRTFNMGIGMVVVVDSEDVEGAIAAASEAGETLYPLGRVVEGQRTVRLMGEGF